MTMPIEWLSVFCTYMISTLGSNSPTSPPYILPLIHARLAWGICCHSSCNVFGGSCWFCGSAGRCWSAFLCWRMFQSCSIGLRSGERLGLFIRSIVLLSKFSFTIRALWSRALSSMKIKPSPTEPAMSLTIEWRIFSAYFKPVMEPSIKRKSVLGNTNACPNHYRASSKSIMLRNVIIGIFDLQTCRLTSWKST